MDEGRAKEEKSIEGRRYRKMEHIKEERNACKLMDKETRMKEY